MMKALLIIRCLILNNNKKMGKYGIGNVVFACFYCLTSKYRFYIIK